MSKVNGLYQDAIERIGEDLVASGMDPEDAHAFAKDAVSIAREARGALAKAPPPNPASNKSRGTGE